MDREAWWAAVHGVTKSQTGLSDFPFTFHFHALEKEMATHSSVLAWRIPRTVEPGGLPSMGSHRVGHDWSDLAAAVTIYFDYSCSYYFCILISILSHCPSFTFTFTSKIHTYTHTHAFELWCWRRLLRVAWTARRSNQSVIKEINPEYSLEGLMLTWSSNSLATWCKGLTH